MLRTFFVLLRWELGTLCGGRWAGNTFTLQGYFAKRCRFNGMFVNDAFQAKGGASQALYSSREGSDRQDYNRISFYQESSTIAVFPKEWGVCWVARTLDPHPTESFLTRRKERPATQKTLWLVLTGSEEGDRK